MSSKVQSLQTWFHDKVKISNKHDQNKRDVNNRVVFQGEVYNCFIGENIGNEKNKTRPVLVLSNNQYNSQLVIIAPLTTTYKKKKEGKFFPKYSTDYVVLKRNYKELRKDSAVDLLQLRSISKARLDNLIFEINDYDLKKINSKLKTIFKINVD